MTISSLCRVAGNAELCRETLGCLVLRGHEVQVHAGARFDPQFAIKTDGDLIVVLEPAVRPTTLVRMLPCLVDNLGIMRWSLFDESGGIGVHADIVIFDEAHSFAVIDEDAVGHHVQALPAGLDDRHIDVRLHPRGFPFSYLSFGTANQVRGTSVSFPIVDIVDSPGIYQRPYFAV